MFLVELVSCGIGLEETAAGTALLWCGGSAALVVDAVADTVGELFNGLYKLMCSIFMRKLKTSPPSPVEKQ